MMHWGLHLCTSVRSMESEMAYRGYTHLGKPAAPVVCAKPALGSASPTPAVVVPEFGSALGSLAPAFGPVAPPLGSVGFVALGSDAFGSVGFDALGSVPAVFVEEGSVLEPVSKGGEVVSDICVESRQKRK